MDFPHRRAVKTYTYVFVRKDMPMHYQIIQAGHALHEIGMQQPDNNGENNIILFEVQSEEELRAVSKYLQGLSIRHHMFYEPDHNTGYTAIATRLIWEEEQARQYFSDFKMWSLDEREMMFYAI